MTVQIPKISDIPEAERTPLVLILMEAYYPAQRGKVSGSTRRSSPGRKCRDTFTNLKKTYRKLGISFWEYIKDRAANLNAVPRLSDLMRAAA